MNIHQNLAIAIDKIYVRCKFEFKGLAFEKEINEYEACSFSLNDKQVIYRTAKITPKKTGQFVAIWKRNNLGVTIPFSAYDNFDLMIISTRTNNFFGQFIFPKLALIENGIISSEFKEGKRGFRVYPPWDKTENKQALNTQKWQFKYFVNLSEAENIKLENAKALLNSRL